MTPPFDIIAFCKDWNEPKTSNNHVLEELAKRHRVLWVNSVATRAPNLASGNDLRKIARKLRSWFRGVDRIHENLRVITPVALPFPRSSLIQLLNRRLVRFAVRAAARSWGLRDPQLWIFPPNAVDYVGQFGESRVVYYCVDEWSQFTHLHAEFMRDKEARLLQRADTVFVVSRRLLETKKALHANIHLIPHGVDHALFAGALSDHLPVAEELRNLPRPIVGFYGNLYDWVDQALLADLARLRPAWSLVLVGKIMCDVATLRACPNIHLLGPRPHEELPRFCKGFDVGIIPYNLRDPRMQSVHPLKLREFLAAGVPVISVDLPEVKGHSDRVRIASSSEEFILAIEETIRHNTSEDKRRRSESVRAESWTARVAQIEAILARASPAPGERI